MIQGSSRSAYRTGSRMQRRWAVGDPKAAPLPTQSVSVPVLKSGQERQVRGAAVNDEGEGHSAGTKSARADDSRVSDNA